MSTEEIKAAAIVDRVAHIPSVALPPLCLPDLHLKEKTEAPCSFVVATHGTIIPELTAPSVGCGMGILATSLTCTDITPERLETFYAAIRRERGPRYGLTRNMLLWLGLTERPKNGYDISKEELAAVISRGAAAAKDIYQLPEGTLDHIEYGGNVMDRETLRAFPPQKILPRSAWISGRHDMGYGFKGNHFLEVQYVEKLCDEATARAWGLSPGQIVIMYHGGGGAVSHYLGRYFAHRKKDNSMRAKLFAFFAKLLFHFGSKEGIHHARERWRCYFAPAPFQEIPLDSFEGKRVAASIKASLNYSYAFRLAIAKRVMDAVKAVWGPDTRVSLVWDTIHNSIMQETINGKDLVVHRHTATRAFAGKPVIVSGYHSTNSILGVGMAHAEEHLFSADHGAGTRITYHHARGDSKLHPARHSTTVYTTKPPYKNVVEHITNEGLEAVVKPLEDAGVMRRVALLRPIAVFKG